MRLTLTQRAANLQAASMFVKDYDAGRPCTAMGDGWLVRMSRHVLSEGNREQPAPWAWRHLSRAARRPDSLIASGHAGESLTTVAAHGMGWL